MKTVKVGIIGGGLIGEEVAGTFGRGFTLSKYGLNVELSAVCDEDERKLSPRAELLPQGLTTGYRELLGNDLIDVVYVALPHHLHKKYYLDVLDAGKDLFAGRSFGVDLDAAIAVAGRAEQLKRFVRCSSEMPFLPGAQRVISELNSGRIGRTIEIKAGFCHSSELDQVTSVNRETQPGSCSEIGVMADLGMHVLHIPLRMGWVPKRVYAHLQKVKAPGSVAGGAWTEGDTWNYASLMTAVDDEGAEVPMTLEMKRLAPGEKNSWFIEVLGTDGGVRYNTMDSRTLWVYDRKQGQSWRRVDLGLQMAFPTMTGSIFGPGFSDGVMQMLTAYFAEREGFLGDRLGCMRPDEAVMSHRVFEAALRSHQTHEVKMIAH